MLSHNEKLAMVKAMKFYGGSFVVALSECFIRADSNNLRKLYDTFPEYVEKYREFAAKMKEREEQKEN